MFDFKTAYLYGLNRIGNAYYNKDVTVFVLYNMSGELVDYGFELNKKEGV
jgi:hypothetical protein